MNTALVGSWGSMSVAVELCSLCFGSKRLKGIMKDLNYDNEQLTLLDKQSLTRQMSLCLPLFCFLFNHEHIRQSFPYKYMVRVSVNVFKLF